MATPGKEFDPNRKYKVILSEQLKNGSRNGGYSIASMQVDAELKLPNSIKSSTLKPGFNRDSVTLSFTNGAAGEKLSYEGKQNHTKTCALIFDPSTQSFILERIDTEFAFAQDQPSPTSENQSEDAIRNALIEEEGAADPDNPYDWRHQLQRGRTPTPELEHLDLDITATPSPESHPVRVKPPRQASTPPEQPAHDLSPESSPEPQEEIGVIIEQEDEEPESDDGGLQISWEGAKKPRHTFSRGRFMQRTLDAAPISLRSAASSQSPALRQESSDESDVDVDEMKLGSPMTGRRKEPEPESEPELDLEADAPAADEGDMDAEDLMAAEFEKALEGDADEMDTSTAPAAPTATYVDDSSSESEEE